MQASSTKHRGLEGRTNEVKEIFARDKFVQLGFEDSLTFLKMTKKKLEIIENVTRTVLHATLGRVQPRRTIFSWKNRV